MTISGAASRNIVRNNLFVDPTTKNLAGSSPGAPSDVTDNCLDSRIDASNIKTSGNVIVPDSSLEPSGDPRNGNFRINTTGTCLAKYGGTMLN